MIRPPLLVLVASLMACDGRSDRRSAPALSPAPTDGSVHADAGVLAEPVWCIVIAGRPYKCRSTASECEKARGALAAPSAPCTPLVPYCFRMASPDADTSICAPTLDGCEQIRTSLVAQEAAAKRADEPSITSGCISLKQVAWTPSREMLLGTDPAETWCSKRECAPTERACLAVRQQERLRAPCVKARTYCSGDAPMPLLDCAASLASCERRREARADRGQGDFGPCYLVP